MGGIRTLPDEDASILLIVWEGGSMEAAGKRSGERTPPGKGVDMTTVLEWKDERCGGRWIRW